MTNMRSKGHKRLMYNPYYDPILHKPETLADKLLRDINAPRAKLNVKQSVLQELKAENLELQCQVAEVAGENMELRAEVAKRKKAKAQVKTLQNAIKQRNEGTKMQQSEKEDLQKALRLQDGQYVAALETERARIRAMGEVVVEMEERNAELKAENTALEARVKEAEEELEKWRASFRKMQVLSEKD